jgi:aspartyl-tRNA(Asn)/glutamyl-tRNA(Gln) amidotransferase subunit C
MLFYRKVNIKKWRNQMVIDEELLKKLEKLSYLNVENSKREEIKKELTQFLEFAENLQELDTNSVDNEHSKFSMTDKSTILRNDSNIYTDIEINQSIINNAPKTEDNFFIVPKIID